MKKATFIFISFLYLLLGVFSVIGYPGIEYQLYFSLFAISIIGIPHGALDNKLFLDHKKVSPVLFYAVYLGAMAINAVFWFKLPLFSLFLFLAISSYHFGQSQFANYKLQPLLKRMLYTSWGVVIISSLLYFRQSEIVAWLPADDNINWVNPFWAGNLINYSFRISLVITLILLIYAVISDEFGLEDFVMEIIILGLILLSFSLLPVVISFTLYFIILHSLKVLMDEYQYLKRLMNLANIKRFIIMLLPLTIVSIVFLVGLLGLVQVGYINISPFLLALILISVFTLPHSIVMEVFYESD